MKNYNGKIEELEKNLIKNLLNNNLSDLDHLLSSDFKLILPNGFKIAKNLSLLEVLSNSLDIEHIELDNITYNYNTQDMVMTTVIFTVRGIFLNKTIDGTYKFVKKYEKNEDQWSIISGSGFDFNYVSEPLA